MRWNWNGTTDTNSVPKKSRAAANDTSSRVAGNPAAATASERHTHSRSICDTASEPCARSLTALRMASAAAASLRCLCIFTDPCANSSKPAGGRGEMSTVTHLNLTRHAGNVIVLSRQLELLRLRTPVSERQACSRPKPQVQVQVRIPGPSPGPKAPTRADRKHPPTTDHHHHPCSRESRIDSRGRTDPPRWPLSL
jgi:hypothetical protein